MDAACTEKRVGACYVEADRYIILVRKESRRTFWLNCGYQSGRGRFKGGCYDPQKSRSKVVRPDGKGKPALAIANETTLPIDWAAFLEGMSYGKTVLEYGANRTIFAQGDPADSVWYLKQGKVKLAVTSRQGKEAIVSVLGGNEFFGEGCLAGQPLRISTATR